MTTFADMTPEQQADCVGMWCEAVIHWENRDSERMVGVISGLQFRNRNAHGPSVLSVPVLSQHPAHTITTFVPVENITPRWDLPRAWQPGGTPVEMDVEGADYRPGTNRGFYILDETIQKGRELPEGTARARRFVGEWEEE